MAFICMSRGVNCWRAGSPSPQVPSGLRGSTGGVLLSDTRAEGRLGAGSLSREGSLNMEMQGWLVTTCVCLCASTDRAQELPSRLGTREGFIASHGNSFPSAISGLRFPTHSRITRLCRFFFFGNLCHEGAKLFELRYTIFFEMSGEKALW